MKTTMPSVRRTELVSSEKPDSNNAGSTTAGIHAAAVVAGETTKTRFEDRGLTFEHAFSKPGIHPYDEIEWEKRTAEITDDSGKAIFKQEDVEVPEELERPGHQDRRLEIFLRRHRPRHRSQEERPRDLGAPARPPRHPHHHRLGPQGRLLQDQGGRRSLLQRPDLALRQPARRLQLARLVQRRPLPPVRRRQGKRPGQLLLQPPDRQGRARPDPV